MKLCSYPCTQRICVITVLQNCCGNKGGSVKKPLTPKSSQRPTGRDLNAELIESLADIKAGRWARKTEFTRRADGAWRRRIVLADGIVEKDEIIPADATAQTARAGTREQSTHQR